MKELSSVHYGVIKKVLKHQFPFINSNKEFMESLENMKYHPVVGYRFTPFIKALDCFLIRNPHQQDYINMQLEQTFMKYDPFNLGHLSYMNLIAIFKKEIWDISPSQFDGNIDLEDKIDYSKLLKEINRFLDELRLNRLDECLPAMTFFNAVADYLQALKSERL